MSALDRNLPVKCAKCEKMVAELNMARQKKIL